MTDPAAGGIEAAPFLSVVVPVYRTAWALPELARRVRAVAAVEGVSHELVVVDDASPDDAGRVAKGLAAADPAIRHLAMDRNVGQHRAVLAGLAASRGEWVVVMDGDLQDPPEAIPRLLERAREGFEAVFAARVGRYQSRGRMATSRLFKRLLARWAGVPPGSGMYFLARRSLVERIVPCDDPRPFVVALVGLAGLPVSSVPVARAERPRGVSAYSGWRRLRAGLAALAFVRRRRRRAREPAGTATPGRTLAALAAGAALLAVLRTLVASRGQALGLGDEGFRYLLSSTWADGASLFESFRLHYVPGQYVYFGAALRLLGPGVDTLRLAAALLGGAAVALLTATVGRTAPPAVTAATAAALAVLTLPDHATIASALVLALAVDLALRRTPGRSWVFSAALVAGLLAGWREDSAVLALVLAGVAVMLRRRPADVPRLVLPGVVLGLLPWVAVFAARSEATEMLAHVGRRLVLLVERLGEPTRPGLTIPPDPLASPRALAAALFPVLATLPPVLYLAVLVREGLRRPRLRAPRWPAVAAALAGLAYLPQFLWERPDPAHLRAHLHLLVAVTGVAVATWSRRSRSLAVAALAVAALVGAADAASRPGRGGTVLYPCCAGRRIGARVPAPAPPWAGLSARGGALVVLGWGPGWYVLEGVPPATRFLYTPAGERGLRDEAAAAELAGDLADPAVRWVLVGPGGEPAGDLAAVFEALYEPVEPWRRWWLWERRAPSPAPASPGSS